MKYVFAASILALSVSAFAHDSTQTLTPSTAAISTSQTSAYAGTGGGLSISLAGNQSTAGVSGTQSGMAGSLGPMKSGSVAIGGAAGTSSYSGAGNLSIGNANGTAQAGGVGQASIIGAGEFHTVSGGPSGTVTGNAESITGSSVAAGTNSAGLSGGSALSSFGADASASQVKLGPLQTADVASHSSSVGVTTPGVQITVGGAVISLQNESAANAFGQAKIGTISSN